VNNFATDAARPALIEAPSNRWLVHPLSDRLLPLALRIGIHPNTVSLAGLACGALAGACYYNWRDPRFVVAGFLWMVAWHVLDGLDGKLARASGKASPLGRVIDGICDYLVFFCVLVPIALSFPNWLQMLGLGLFAGIFHALQAGWYQGEREAWKRRARGVFTPAIQTGAGWWIEKNYNKLETRVAAGNRAVDATLSANRAALDDYLATTAPIVRAMALLSSNSRTIAIALACLAGDPRLYWYWEIAGMTLIALTLAWRVRQGETGFVQRHAAVQTKDVAGMPIGHRQVGD
jgi:phosphatidylglycerophosphate synthase